MWLEWWEREGKWRIRSREVAGCGEEPEFYPEGTRGHGRVRSRRGTSQTWISGKLSREWVEREQEWHLGNWISRQVTGTWIWVAMEELSCDPV